MTLESIISEFGAAAAAKLSNPSVTGEPEDQLRAPLEGLISNLAALIGIERKSVSLVGESSLSDLKTRPDFAVTIGGALIGFIEVKAPGKGANPRRFRGHDKAQWEKLESLPNLLYTDGNEFSLWRSGESVGSIVRFAGDIERSGSSLEAPNTIVTLIEDFLRWHPVPPRSAKQLAEMTARCSATKLLNN
jgi:hypothetical protein